MTIHRRHFMQTTLGAAAAISLAGRVRGRGRPTTFASPRSASTARAAATSTTWASTSSPCATSTRRCSTSKADDLEEKLERKVDTVHRLSQAAGAQRHRRRVDRHAQPHARADHDRRGAGGQARVRREAGVAQHVGRPADGRRRPQVQQDRADRHAVPLEPRPARKPSSGSTRASSAPSSTPSAPATSGRPSIGKSDTPLEFPELHQSRPVGRPRRGRADLSARRRTPRASTNPALRLALGLQHRRRRPGQPGHPPDGHRPLVPRRDGAGAARAQHRRPARLRRRRQHGQHADRLPRLREGAADLRGPRPAAARTATTWTTTAARASASSSSARRDTS